MPGARKRKSPKKSTKGQFDIDDVLGVGADHEHGDMPMKRPAKGTQLGEGLGLEKEERYLVVPNRVMALITAGLFESGGTYILIFGVSMAIATLGFAPAGSRVASGLAYGFIFAFLHAIFSKYSGGHFNPATSLAVFLGYQFSRDMKGEWFKNGWGKLAWGTLYLIVYTVLQIIFAFFAGWTLEWVLQGDGTGLGVPVSTAVTSLGRSLFVEAVFTLVITLGYYILVMERSKGHLDSILFGLAYAGFYMAAAAVSGGGFNPVRYGNINIDYYIIFTIYD